MLSLSTICHFDADALLWFARRSDPAMALDGRWSKPFWDVGRRDLEHLFGLDRPASFLRQHRGLLPKLRETQITQAIRAFLLEVPNRTVERCQALIDALQESVPCQLKSVRSVTADAQDRMDLAIHCTDEKGMAHCIVIEAKFESELSDTQLKKYRMLVSKDYPRRDQRHFCVVAPRRTRRTNALLSKPENGEWRFLTWRTLLLRWQRTLSDQPGTDALSLFAEIWKRTGGR